MSMSGEEWNRGNLSGDKWKGAERRNTERRLVENSEEEEHYVAGSGEEWRGGILSGTMWSWVKRRNTEWNNVGLGGAEVH